MHSAFRSVLSGLLVLVVLTGIGFRFYNLDKKVFWMDEASTAQWIAGYSLQQIEAELSQRQNWSPTELAKFQHLNPGNGIDATRYALASDDPKHPPLFYLLLRAWAGLAGDSVFALRLFPALVSLLVLPAMWWLCRELFFEDPHRATIGKIALALTALSPVHVLYAQEAREYSLWTAVMLASSALLLRAMRCDSPKWWVVYALSLAVGFYTHTLFLLLWLVHAIVIGGVWWHTKNQENRRNSLRPFFMATLGAALLFAPWSVQIILQRSGLSSNSAWLAQSSSFSYLLQTWVFLSGIAFFDPNQTQHWNIDNNLLITAVRLLRGLFCVLIAGALFIVARRATHREALFILTLSLVPFLALAIPDVFTDGYRSTIARFLIPCFLGFQLAIAWLLANALSNRAWRRPGMALLTVLLGAGFFSCLLSSQADAWWNKSASYHVPRVANLINSSPKPLLVLAPNPNLLALCRRLDPQIQLFLLKEKQADGKAIASLPPVPTGTTVLFYRPSPGLLAALQKQGDVLTPTPAGNDLWQLKKS